MHLSATIPQTGEHETKYVFPNTNVIKTRSWLGRLCQPDPAYSTGIISSIYFDTSDFLHLREKLSSDYLKTKIRLRWYTACETLRPYSTLFLEAKYKIGSARKKQRHTLTIPSSWVMERALHNPEYHIINKLIRELGIPLHENLLPVLQISYTRTRYIDHHSGARLSIDNDIHVPRWNSALLPGRNLTVHPSAVFEFKDPSGQLPERLAPITAMAGAKRSSFSKYSECYAHTQGITY